ncbi:MAG: undecaprenyl-diphosphate phosphatase [Planctomycetota bacterium]
MEWYEAVILGLVEGITEYLPVSSTGHLILASEFLGLNDDPEQKAAVDAYNIVIQGGAILAVLGLYFKRIMQMLRGIIGRDDAGRKLFINLFIAFCPAVVLGLLLEDVIEARLFFTVPVITALAAGGVLMLFVGRAPKASHRELTELTWKLALFIGLLQCVAMWPGTSRSMMTIVGGLLVGLRGKDAAEFSFLLGLPTLGGACAYKALKSFAGDGPDLVSTLGVDAIIIGFIVATISAAIAVKWLVAYLSKHGVAMFGWYRLALSAVLTILIVGNWMSPIRPEAAPEPPASTAVE